MRKTGAGDDADEKRRGPDGAMESGRQKTLLKTGTLQSAIFNSANFSNIATDTKGVIQIFNVSAERVLGAKPLRYRELYAAIDALLVKREPRP